MVANRCATLELFGSGGGEYECTIAGGGAQRQRWIPATPK